MNSKPDNKSGTGGPIDSEHWRKVKGIIRDAQSLEPEARAIFLEKACGGDEELHQRMISLLNVNTSEKNRFEKLLYDHGFFEGKKLGPYAILKEIGRGGMGAVYLAEQQEPVVRLVAIKVLAYPILDSRLLRRFQTEQSLLARMNHSYIGRLYESGATDRGVPYFVMEYIEGAPISRFCDQNQLDLHQRLALFNKVCEAVGHAHLKGIMHRDIKPSNILVIEENGAPIPKIIDFGVARAFEENAYLTRQGDTPGTLRYMSPEQAGLTEKDGARVELDLRTDVYSLGVLLYELLTGTTPLTWPLNCPFPAVYEMICAKTPPLPSQRWRSLSIGERTKLAEYRKTDPAKISANLKGDLDWITMKALAKHPKSRYRSPSELVDEINRFSRSLPVEAGPPGVIYLLGKFIRRNKLIVVAALSLSILIIGFTLSLAFEKRKTAWERDKARLERDRGEQVIEFLIDMFKSSDPYEQSNQTKDQYGAMTAVEFLEWGKTRIERDLKDQPEIQAKLFSIIGEVYTNLGQLDNAYHSLKKALEIYRGQFGEKHLEIARAMDELGLLLLLKGDHEGSEPLITQALIMRRELLGGNDLEVANSLDHLAKYYKQTDQYARAEPLYREALSMQREFLGEDHLEIANVMNNLADLLQIRGDIEGARDLFRRVLAMRCALLNEEHALIAESMHNLAYTLRDLGSFDEARSLFEEALKRMRRHLGRKHPKVATVMDNFATLLLYQKDYEKADAIARESLAIRLELNHGHPGIGLTWNTLALIAMGRGDKQEAEHAYREALAAYRSVHGEDHLHPAIVTSNLANHYNVMGEYIEAESRALQALAVFCKILPEGHWRTAMAEGELGNSYVGQDRFEEAEPLLLNHYQILEASMGADSSRAESARQKLLDLYTSWGKQSKAELYRTKH